MMNWAALTKKQQQLVMITMVLAVVQILLMVHFLGFTKPASARGGAAKKELLDLQSKLDDARSVLKREGTISSELVQAAEKLETLAANAPTLSDRYAWAYEYVSRCATLAHVELDSLEEITFMSAAKKDVSKKDAAKKDTEAQPYEISIATRCGYNTLVEFLWRLEKDNPLLRVKEVTVSSIREQSQVHQIRIIMQWPASVKIERGTP